jgi:hypothetical protein
MHEQLTSDLINLTENGTLTWSLIPDANPWHVRSTLDTLGLTIDVHIANAGGQGSIKKYVNYELTLRLHSAVILTNRQSACISDMPVKSVVSGIVDLAACIEFQLACQLNQVLDDINALARRTDSVPLAKWSSVTEDRNDT